MKQSQLFTKTVKNIPKDEQSINAQLLIKAGYIDKLMAGVYSYLPLGLRVLQKINNIIREEMAAIGSQEILMPALHGAENWQATKRWDEPVMFKLQSRTNKKYGLGWTHEEIVTPLVQKYVHSYKDLPVSVFQIQTKFRDELRAKSGILRGIEFVMKDMYSFHLRESDLDEYYDQVAKAYFKVFERLGLKESTFLTFASGGAFAKYSHEFQTITESGEDIIHFCPKCQIAINEEIIGESKQACVECGNKELEQKKAIEVGNIFKLKTRFSAAFKFKLADDQEVLQEVMMGCYGMGPSRLMGAIVEVLHDDKGLIWPEQVAPYKVHLISLGQDKEVVEQADILYQDLLEQGQEVLYDDRDEAAGVKLNDADLLGLPIRVVISKKTLAEKSVEVKARNKDKAEMIKIKDLPKKI